MCRRKYTPEGKVVSHPETLRRQAVQMATDGVNYRRIGRFLGVSHRSVMNWVNAHADALPAQPPRPAEPLAVSELDELFTFIGNKKT